MQRTLELTYNNFFPRYWNIVFEYYVQQITMTCTFVFVSKTSVFEHISFSLIAWIYMYCGYLQSVQVLLFYNSIENINCNSLVYKTILLNTVLLIFNKCSNGVAHLYVVSLLISLPLN